MRQRERKSQRSGEREVAERERERPNPGEDQDRKPEFWWVDGGPTTSSNRAGHDSGEAE
jgi:hypothetical protein